MSMEPGREIEPKDQRVHSLMGSIRRLVSLKTLQKFTIPVDVSSTYSDGSTEALLFDFDSSNSIALSLWSLPEDLIWYFR